MLLHGSQVKDIAAQPAVSEEQPVHPISGHSSRRTSISRSCASCHPTVILLSYQRHGYPSPNGTVQMKIMDLFNSDKLKRSQKRKAFKTITAKLDKTKDKLEKELKAEDSKAKIKRLEAKLKTNKKQRKKAKMLLADLD